MQILAIWEYLLRKLGIGQKKIDRHPDNVPGAFFVENQHCITCGAPEIEAPNLMSHDNDGHCYFKRQPETPEEKRQAVKACWFSCCGAVQYEGNDEEILHLFRDVADEHKRMMAQKQEKG